MQAGLTAAGALSFETGKCEDNDWDVIWIRPTISFTNHVCMLIVVHKTFG